MRFLFSFSQNELFCSVIVLMLFRGRVIGWSGLPVCVCVVLLYCPTGILPSPENWLQLSPLPPYHVVNPQQSPLITLFIYVKTNVCLLDLVCFCARPVLRALWQVCKRSTYLQSKHLILGRICKQEKKKNLWSQTLAG